jgi:anti-sigma B factor antagonist
VSRSLCEKEKPVNVREEREGEIIVLEPLGRIDSTTAPMIGDRLSALLGARGTSLVLDFKSLEYISSAGFRVILLAAKQADAAGSRFVLCNITGKVRQIFELAGFLDLLPIHASREESLASLK